MCDQSLGLREFELERVAQELSDQPFDFFGFTSWADEAKKEIVSITDVA